MTRNCFTKPHHVIRGPCISTQTGSGLALKNMCGLCFKCKRLMELLEKTPGALPLRRKRSVAPTSQKNVEEKEKEKVQPQQRSRSRDITKRSVKHSVRRHRAPSVPQRRGRTVAA